MGNSGVAGAPGRASESPQVQKGFFEAHLAQPSTKFFEALRNEPDSNYYRRVADFGAVFVAVEEQAFQLS